MIRCLLGPIVFTLLIASPLFAQSDPAIAVAVPEEWDTFSADVTLHHQRLAAGSDAPQVSAPDSTFHLERTRAGGGWKTLVTVVASGSPEGAPGSDGAERRSGQAHVGMRIEDAGDGSPLRLVDRSGKELRLPQMKELRRRLGNPVLLRDASLPSIASMAANVPHAPMATVPDWTDGFVIPAAGRDARMAALQQRQGPRQDRLRGLDRYVTSQDGRQSELLVDPSSALPLETNVVENGMLTTHATYQYARYGSDAWVRTRLQVERLLPGGTGERSITVIDTNNVRFEQRGGAR